MIPSHCSTGSKSRDEENSVEKASTDALGWAGATREEIAETVFMAAALRAGGAVGHGLLTMKLFDQAQKGLEKDPHALDREPWE
jgi:hypothetical protein